ncbi:PAP2 family lipid A phosphatase [Psychrobacter sp. NG25]|uniref:PAP2 family lipid A phosphatase n=1 Tax=Psychrobacter sp. NG25 TaxID=2782005 RepID=UPI0018833AFF|nr:PAP2 family lipid A phosphatase [Psychrobacter sp. NG25]MBF0657713.1 PAP2 family lipid A phosphatase [Psychrobacter sp. NG25]
MILEDNSTDWVWLKLLCLTIITALTFEHSQFDIRISELFYSHGQWLIQKDAQPYAFIFYDGPKASLILLALYLITVLILKYRQYPNSISKTNSSKLRKFIIPLSMREISYLLTILIVVPTSIALLKGVTHVSCPNHLTLFGGSLPYLNIWQNIVADTPAKCFPAAHASAGFSLYGLVFLPTLKKYRYRIFESVTVLGWTMGLYKMLFGDHFFSHTLVSMLLSLTIACALATFVFKDSITKKAKSVNSNKRQADNSLPDIETSNT